MHILTYDVLHVFGAVCLFLGVGGMAAIAMIDGGSAESVKSAGKIFAILHGVGLLILLVAGFGALAKLGAGFPLWVLVKIVIWFFFGASVMFFKRAPGFSKILVLLLPLAGLVAAYLGNFKSI